MQILFDKYNLYEIPSFILCNPDMSEIYSLGGISDRRYKPRYNALSELSFRAPYKVDNVVSDYYSSLVYRRLVLLEGIGYFMITNVEENDNGIVREKEVTCQSIEVESNLKRLTNFQGTYQFYDIISPSNTLLGTILTYLPGWTIGSIDTELTTLFRTFNVSDTSIYNFLTTIVEDSYQCVIVFDSLLKTISAHTVGNAVTATDIYLSHDNVIENLKIREISDEICTALTVRGAGDLSIAQVNPLGTDILYNFTYFKTTSWMSQSLIDAITAWEAKVLAKQQEYADLLTLLRESNENLITLESELVDLNTDMSALVGIQGARIQQGIDYSDINVLINTKQTEIDSKQAEIDNVNSTIGVADETGVYPAGSIMAQLVDINTYVSFDSNFTTIQKNELSAFELGNTYTNENFIQTDIMTQAEIQDQAQALFDQAIDILAKVSVPRYEFSVDAVNFVFLKEFQNFITQLELGHSITLQLDENTYIYPVLLGMDLNYDDPTDFSLIFGNRLRLDDSSYTFSDLFGQTINQGITTSFNSEQWGSWNINYKDDVSTFITSALDASKNAVISGSMQDVIINQNGLRGRSSVGSGLYSPEQVWLINNMLAFTDDNWTTSKLALGKISTSSGSAFGLAGQVIVGNIIAGNNLTITNQNNTFTVNGNGATLTNATLTVNTTSGKTKIFLDPTNGIKIQGLVGGNWIDKFYADSNGNIIFSGNLSGATGTFSGTLSAATISGGTITGAAINGGTISGTTGTFSGNIYADKIFGSISYSQLTDIPASKITSGTMSGNRINGGYMGNVGITTGGSIYSTQWIHAEDYITTDGNIVVWGGGSAIHGGLVIENGANVYGGLGVSGNINVNGYYGQNYSAVLRRYDNTRIQLNFTNGILTSIT